MTVCRDGNACASCWSWSTVDHSVVGRQPVVAVLCSQDGWSDILDGGSAFAQASTGRGTFFPMASHRANRQIEAVGTRLASSLRTSDNHWLLTRMGRAGFGMIQCRPPSLETSRKKEKVSLCYPGHCCSSSSLSLLPSLVLEGLQRVPSASRRSCSSCFWSCSLSVWQHTHFVVRSSEHCDAPGIGHV